MKLKCVHEQEFVVGGFTLPSNESHGVGALLLGYYDGEKLIYAGRTGTGFTQKTHKFYATSLMSSGRRRVLSRMYRRRLAWGDLGEPDLVAQVNFSTWTADNLVRQAAFRGCVRISLRRRFGGEEPGLLRVRVVQSMLRTLQLRAWRRSDDRKDEGASEIFHDERAGSADTS